MTDQTLGLTQLVSVPPIDFSEKIKVHRQGFKDLFTNVHEETVNEEAITIHYYALATDLHGKPKIAHLVEWLFTHVTFYVLHGHKIEQSQGDQRLQNGLMLEAMSKFQSTAGDEAGEFLLWAFLEAVLDAPQAVAKMSHKDNPKSPVLGADAIHARWDAAKKKLTLLFGESKLHKDASDCIGSAFKSLEESISEAGILKERSFLTDHPSKIAPGLENALEAWWRSQQIDFDVDLAYAFLLGFDLPAYQELYETKFADPRAHVLDAYKKYHGNLKKMVSGRLPLSGRTPTQELYVFFLPFHSVEKFREEFLRARRGYAAPEEAAPKEAAG